VTQAWRGPVLLGAEIAFPSPARADAEGLLALGGDLSVPRLVAAYRRGIFPWFAEGEPIAWYSPHPRTVLWTPELHVSRRLERTLRQQRFLVTLDRGFDAVIEACATVERRGQTETWITREMVTAYQALHREGLAHSAEAWLGEQLVGGVYGVSVGRSFAGESMFHLVPDAAKVALVTLVRQLEAWGIHLFDCQLEAPHLRQLGARPWSRRRFLRELARTQRHPSRRGIWQLEV
jgi:leucyl/phenylalanyl-tRNA--protein transferase